MLKIDKNLGLAEDSYSIFASRAYLESLNAESFGWISSDLFAIPYYIKKNSILRYLTFVAAPIHRQDGSPAAASGQLQEFVNALPQFVKGLGIAMMTQPMASALFPVCPNSSKSIPFGTYVVDLRQDTATLLQNLHGKHRNAMRKAEKDGIQIKQGPSYLSPCHALIQETMSRQNRNCPSLGYLEKLSQSFGDNIRFYVAASGEEYQTSAVLVWNRFSSYYLHGGACDKPSSGANNLLHWTAMLEMKSLGVQAYDFLGARIQVDPDSKLAGIQQFKERFGSQLRTGYLWKADLQPLRVGVYHFLQNMRQRYRGEPAPLDAIDEESKRLQQPPIHTATSEASPLSD